MQIVNIIFGGKLFRFFWILYGEIGGFSSLFTLYGYYIRYVYVWIHHSIKYGLFNEWKIYGFWMIDEFISIIFIIDEEISIFPYVSFSSYSSSFLHYICIYTLLL